jgi:hypothetical protein
MNRADLRVLVRLRLREARVLLAERQAAGAYYLAGYAVECGLKACIARTTHRFDFPDKTRTAESHTHDLLKLVRLAQLERDFQAHAAAEPRFAVNWGVVKDWTPNKRYSGTITLQDAADLYRAITARRVGVMTWVRRHW